mgnify:CR=1 FL=1
MSAVRPVWLVAGLCVALSADEHLWCHLNEETKMFLLKESSGPYVRLAQQLFYTGVGEEVGNHQVTCSGQE